MCLNALKLCPVSEAIRSKGIGIDIIAMGTAERDELLEHWQALIGRLAPKQISRALFIQILAFEMLAELNGGYSKRLSQRRNRAGMCDVMRPAFKTGSRFVREYREKTHVVEMGEDSCFF